MKALLAWLLSMFLSFGAGVSAGKDYQADTELEQKVQAHMDVIVDEAAGIVDDVSESARQRRETVESEFKESDEYKKAKKFVDDVQEIADNTAADIDAHFGTAETETEALTEAEVADDIVTA
ncbi:MAG TPA: hypothetical protein DHV42_07225 [Lachnospiraceae bacterium]|jgi:hypothetical protein|nr:hypothetical protein [Lachnospiraceae bacterium]